MSSKEGFTLTQYVCAKWVRVAFSHVLDYNLFLVAFKALSAADGAGDKGRKGN